MEDLIKKWDPDKVLQFLDGFRFTRDESKKSPGRSGFGGLRLLDAQVSTFVRLGYTKEDARTLQRAVADLLVPKITMKKPPSQTTPRSPTRPLKYMATTNRKVQKDP